MQRRGRSSIVVRVKKIVEQMREVKAAFMQVGEAIGEAEIDLTTLKSDVCLLAEAEDLDFTEEIRDLYKGIVVYEVGFLGKAIRQSRGATGYLSGSRAGLRHHLLL